MLRQNDISPLLRSQPPSQYAVPHSSSYGQSSAIDWQSVRTLPFHQAELSVRQPNGGFLEAHHEVKLADAAHESSSHADLMIFGVQKHLYKLPFDKYSVGTPYELQENGATSRILLKWEMYSTWQLLYLLRMMNRLGEKLRDDIFTKYEQRMNSANGSGEHHRSTHIRSDTQPADRLIDRMETASLQAFELQNAYDDSQMMGEETDAFTSAPFDEDRKLWNSRKHFNVKSLFDYFLETTISEGQAVRLAFAEYRSVRLLVAVCCWLRWEARYRPGAISEEEIFYSSSPPVTMEASKLNYEREKLITPEGAEKTPPLFFHMDWIYQCEDKFVENTDIHSLAIFYRKLWMFLRVGAIKMAEKFVKKNGQAWLLAFLHGNEAWVDPNVTFESFLESLEGFDINELAESEWIIRPCLLPAGYTIKDLNVSDGDYKDKLEALECSQMGRLSDGNRWRALFKKTCQKLCGNGLDGPGMSSPALSRARSRFSIHQKAVFGYMAGDLLSLQAVCENYKDYIFATAHYLKEKVIERCLLQTRGRLANQLFTGESTVNSIISSSFEFLSAGKAASADLPFNESKSLDDAVLECLEGCFNDNSAIFRDFGNFVSSNVKARIFEESRDSFQELQLRIILGELNPYKYTTIYDRFHKWSENGFFFRGKICNPVPDSVRLFFSYFATALDDIFDLESEVSVALKPSTRDKDSLIGGFVRDVIEKGRAFEVFELLLMKSSYLSLEKQIESFAALLSHEFSRASWMSKEGFCRLEECIIKLSSNFTKSMLPLVCYMFNNLWESAMKLYEHSSQSFNSAEFEIQNIKERLQFLIQCLVVMYQTMTRGSETPSGDQLLNDFLSPVVKHKEKQEGEDIISILCGGVCRPEDKKDFAILFAGLYILELANHLCLLGLFHESNFFAFDAAKLNRLKSVHQKNFFETLSMTVFIVETMKTVVYDDLMLTLKRLIRRNPPLPQCLVESSFDEDFEVFLREEVRGDTLIGNILVPLEALHHFHGLLDFATVLKAETEFFCHHADEMKFSRVEEVERLLNQQFAKLQGELIEGVEPRSPPEDATYKISERCSGIVDSVCAFLEDNRRGVFPENSWLCVQLGCSKMLGNLMSLPSFCEGANSPPSPLEDDENNPSERDDKSRYEVASIMSSHTGIIIRENEKEEYKPHSFLPHRLPMRNEGFPFHPAMTEAEIPTKNVEISSFLQFLNWMKMEMMLNIISFPLSAFFFQFAASSDRKAIAEKMVKSLVSSKWALDCMSHEHILEVFRLVGFAFI